MRTPGLQKSCTTAKIGCPRPWRTALPESRPNCGRGRHLLELVREIPLDRLMIETDAPYLTPRTLRPQPHARRNEPAFLPHILATIAQALGMPLEAVARCTTENAHRFFRL